MENSSKLWRNWNVWLFPWLKDLRSTPYWWICVCTKVRQTSPYLSLGIRVTFVSAISSALHKGHVFRHKTHVLRQSTWTSSYTNVRSKYFSEITVSELCKIVFETYIDDHKPSHRFFLHVEFPSYISSNLFDGLDNYQHCPKHVVSVHFHRHQPCHR